MPEISTPRSDAESFYCRSLGIYVIPRKLARTLERETIALRAERDAAVKKWSQEQAAFVARVEFVEQAARDLRAELEEAKAWRNDAEKKLFECGVEIATLFTQITSDEQRFATELGNLHRQLATALKERDEARMLIGKDWPGTDAIDCARELWNNNWLDKENIEDAAKIIAEFAKRLFVRQL